MEKQVSNIFLSIRN